MRLRPDWNFEKMGIGGLDTEFSDIFRRAFASRVFDSSFVQKLGIKHVKGKCTWRLTRFDGFVLAPLVLIPLLRAAIVRYLALRPSGYGQNVDGASDR